MKDLATDNASLNILDWRQMKSNISAQCVEHCKDIEY